MKDIADFDIQPHQRLSRFGIAAVILFMLFAFSVAGGIDLAVEQAERQEIADAEAAASAMLRSLTDKHCPRQDSETLPIVTLHIRTQADDKPEVAGCSRYAKRPMVPRRNTFKQVSEVAAR